MDDPAALNPSFGVTPRRAPLGFRKLARLLFGTPIALPPELVARHPELRRVHWRLGGLPPRVGGWALGQRSVQGLTLGHTVFLDPQAPLRPSLLLHELAHVHQFERDRAFPIRYLLESLRRGYHANRYELEANSYAAAELARPSSGA